MKQAPASILAFWVLLLCATVLGAAGCHGKRAPLLSTGQEVPIQKTTFSFDKDKIASDYMPLYTIAPGDQLDVLFQVRSWVQREEFRIAVDHTVEVKFVLAPELNQSQRVRPDGVLSLPYVGDVFVIGKTVEELTGELKDRYRKILRSAELYVLVPDFRSAIKELKNDLHTAPRGLSRLVTVRPDGFVTFPMVGDIRVAGRSIPDVNAELNKLYGDYLPGLHCDLFLETHTGSVIYVQGEVKAPGSFKIMKPISVLEAIALAGSWTPGARLDDVIVVRKHGEKLVATRVDLAGGVDLSGNGSFFYLQPDDIVLVTKTPISRAAEIMRDIMDIIMFRGWGVSLSYGLEEITF